MRFKFAILLFALAGCRILAQVPEAGIWSRFEISISAARTYNDPYTETRFIAEFTGPDKEVSRVYGFYAGGNIWKLRFMPDKKGQWKYKAWLEGEKKSIITGKFNCVDSDIPGLISKDETNPAWFGFRGGNKVQIRSLHAGDRFFASNWSDTERDVFIDWLCENKYNTLSVASHLLNRNAEDRGKGWLTPDLWNEKLQRPNPEEYDKMERILDMLAAKKILVFPFAGFFGQRSDHPTDSVNQAIYLDYTLARLGSYWNLLYSVAGPEPLLRNVNQFTKEEVEMLGEMISDRDPYNHLLTVHNAKNRNPFVNSPFASYQCLQGPTTLNLDTLYLGLMARRHPSQPLYAQEVLWSGNRYQQEYGDVNLRKNAYTILMTGAALNFSDNAGTSSTGFSGTLNLDERVQHKHDIIKKVWDFFETIPFQRMTPSMDLTDNGYCMGEKGKMYLAYLPYGGSVNINTDGTRYFGTWINAADTKIKIATGLSTGRDLAAPTNDDWLLLLTKEKMAPADYPASQPFLAGRGSYPDIAADREGRLHMVYVRDGRLYYRNFDPLTSALGSDWQGEAPDICVTPSGEVYVISHSGELFTLTEKEMVFTSLGQMVSCGNRDLPSVNAGEDNGICVTAFGGKYNFYRNGKMDQEGKISPPTGQSVGFVDNCFAGNKAWLIWEEGQDVNNEELEGTSLIFISNIGYR